MSMGFGVKRVEDTSRIHDSFSVESDGDRVTAVVEKPREIVNDLLGLGFYFFTDDIFDYIDRTPPSDLRGEVEITDVIALMVEDGVDVRALPFEGLYLNLNYPSDLAEIEAQRGPLDDWMADDRTGE